MKERAEEIGQLIAREVGMQVKLATMIQAGLPITVFGTFAEVLRDFTFEERIGNSLVLREPVGVVTQSLRGTTRCTRSLARLHRLWPRVVP